MRRNNYFLRGKHMASERHQSLPLSLPYLGVISPLVHTYGAECCCRRCEPGALVVTLHPQTVQQHTKRKSFILFFATLVLPHTVTTFVSSEGDHGRRTKPSLERICSHFLVFQKIHNLSSKLRKVTAAALCNASPLPPSGGEEVETKPPSIILTAV